MNSEMNVFMQLYLLVLHSAIPRTRYLGEAEKVSDATEKLKRRDWSELCAQEIVTMGNCRNSRVRGEGVEVEIERTAGRSQIRTAPIRSTR